MGHPTDSEETAFSNADQDVILVKNLQIPHGVVAPDVWNKPKEQPALLSIRLVLRGAGFSSAADKDQLDASTIHYGQLAKRIRAASREGQTVEEICENAGKVARAMASKGEKADFIVASTTMDLSLPKASMGGEGVKLSTTTRFDESGKTMAARKVFAVEQIKTMLLLGVNSYERGQRQPVIASLWVHHDHAEVNSLFALEQKLRTILQDTAYETLESLADYTIQHMQSHLSELSASHVRLRLEKPRAIAFADAPAVEVSRTVHKPSMGHVVSVRSAAGSAGSVPEALESLNVIKPYTIHQADR